MFSLNPPPGFPLRFSQWFPAKILAKVPVSGIFVKIPAGISRQDFRQDSWRDFLPRFSLYWCPPGFSSRFLLGFPAKILGKVRRDFRKNFPPRFSPRSPPEFSSRLLLGFPARIFIKIDFCQYCAGISCRDCRQGFRQEVPRWKSLFDWPKHPFTISTHN